MTDSVTSSSTVEDDSSSIYNPRYSSFDSLRYRKSRRGPTEKFRHERERYYTNTPHATLIKLLIEEEYESKKIRKLLDAALAQLETYAEHLKTAESEQHLALSHIQSLVNVQNEAAAARQKAALYEMQFHNAKQELEKATAIISTLEKQRNEAEVSATSARATARKLNEERLTFMAREQGKREGFEEGVRLGKESAIADFEEQRLLEYESLRRSRIDEVSPRGAFIEEHSIGEATPSPNNTPLARQRTTSTIRTSTTRSSTNDHRPTVETGSDEDDIEAAGFTPSPAPAPAPQPEPTPPSIHNPIRDRVRSMDPPKRPSSAGSGSAHSSRTSETSSSVRQRVQSTSASRLGKYAYPAPPPPMVTASTSAPPPRSDYYNSVQAHNSGYSSSSDTESTEVSEHPRSAPPMSQRQREKQPAHTAYMPAPAPGYSPNMSSLDIQRSHTPVEIFLPHMPMPPPPVDSRPPSAAPIHRSTSVPMPTPSTRMQIPQPTVQVPIPTPATAPYPQPQSNHRPAFQVETSVDRNGHGRRGSSPESMSSNATGSISHLQLLSFPSGQNGSHGKGAKKEKKKKVLTMIPEVHDSPSAIRDYRGERSHHKRSVSTPVNEGWGQPRAAPEVNGWTQPQQVHPAAATAVHHPQPPSVYAPPASQRQSSVYAPPSGHHQPSMYAQPPAPQPPAHPSAQAIQDKRRQNVEDWRRQTTPSRPPPEQPPFVPPAVTLTRSESLDTRRPPSNWAPEHDRHFLSPMPDPSAPRSRLTRSNSSASSTVGITVVPPSRPVSMSSTDSDSPTTPTNGINNAFLSPNHPPAPLPQPQVQHRQPVQQHPPPRPPSAMQRPPSRPYQAQPPSRQPSPFVPNVHDGDHILHTGKTGAALPSGFIPQPSMPPDPAADLAIRVSNAEDAGGVRDSFIARSPSAPPKPVLLRSSRQNNDPVIPGGFEPDPSFIPPLSPRRHSTALGDHEGPVIPVPPPPGGGGDYYENASPLPVPSPRMPAPGAEKTISPSMFTRVLASEHDRNDGDIPTEVDEPVIPVIPKKKKKTGKR